MEAQLLDVETCQVALDACWVSRLRQGSISWADPTRSWRELSRKTKFKEASYAVRLWGRTLDGRSICVMVTDPVSTVYRRLDDSTCSPGKLHELASAIEDALKIPGLGSDSARVKVVWRHTTNGWTDDPRDPSRPALFPWLSISVVNFFARCAIQAVCVKVAKDLGLVKALTPITAEKSVEVHTELLQKIKVKPGGWFRLKPNVEILENSQGRVLCTLYAQVLTSDMLQSDRTDAAPVRVLSYDIECFSESGAFPDASKPEDPIIAISLYEKTLFSDRPDERVNVVYLSDSHFELSSPNHKVHCYSTESALLSSFAELLRHSDADVVVGYNTCLFDWRYISERVELLRERKCLSAGAANEIFCISRVRTLSCPSVEAPVASSAMGDNPLHHPRLPGRFEVDLWFYLKRQNNPGLPNLKLDTVSACYLGDSKHDLPAKEMFAKHREGPEGQRTVAAYCVQDTKLVLDLVEKLDVLPNVLQMAKVTSVVPQDINFRGQQIKVYTQIVEKAHELNYVVEDTGSNQTDPADQEYVGAHVVEPTVGYYLDPILTLDFASLYPSLIQTYNLSFDTRVTKEDTQAESLVVPNTSHRFVSSSVRRGLLPLILDELLAERKRVRKLAAQTEDKLQKNLLNCTQLALKISANSCYGFTGSTKGLMTCIEVAESTTGAGRELIHFSSDTIEREWPGAKVVYGDSVTGDTPLIVQNHRGQVETVRIDELMVCEDAWVTSGFKEETCVNNLKVWNETGRFTPIIRVIRHKCQKRLVRVVTPRGFVDCTEDHSLLSADGQEVRPANVDVGTELLHLPAKLTLPIENDEITVAEALVLGRWLRRSDSTDVHTRLKEVGAVSRHGRFFWNRHRERRLPGKLLGAPYDVILAFWLGLFDNGAWIGFNSKELLAGLWVLATRLGLTPRFDIEANGELRLTASSPTDEINDSKIISLKPLIESAATTVVVYDLETENHHFHVGPGDLVVHNTDSCFVRLPEELRSLDEYALFDLGEKMAERITMDFAERFGVQRSFVTLEMEKFLRPLALYKKKRYAGLCYEEPGKPPKMYAKGIEMVRRDAAPIVRKTQQDVLEAIICNSDVGEGVALTKKAVEYVLSLPPGGPFSEIAQSKTLKAKYTNPGSMVHVCVVDLINSRNPGSAPRVGERVSFVVVASETPRVVDKVEDVGFAESELLPPDWTHYVDMLERPLMRLLDVPLKSLDPRKLEDLEVFFLEAKKRSNAQVRQCSLARHGAGWLNGHRTTSGTQLKLTSSFFVQGSTSQNKNAAMLSSPPQVVPRIYGWQPMSSEDAERVTAPSKKRKTTTNVAPKVTLDGWLLKRGAA